MFFDKFLDSMATVGQLFPPVPPVQTGGGTDSAWRGVAASFAQAGDSIRAALKEFSEYQAQSA
jgi:hypothetical protein